MISNKDSQCIKVSTEIHSLNVPNALAARFCLRYLQCERISPQLAGQYRKEQGKKGNRREFCFCDLVEVMVPGEQNKVTVLYTRTLILIFQHNLYNINTI